MKKGDLRIRVLDSLNYTLEIVVKGPKTGELYYNRLGYWNNLESLCFSAVTAYPAWTEAQDIQKAIDRAQTAIKEALEVFFNSDPLAELRASEESAADRGKDAATKRYAEV